MNTFDVTWSGQIEAPNAFSAAGKALATIREGSALTFAVGDDKIDLNADTGFTARTLRPGGTYVSRNGYPAEITSWDEGGDLPLYVCITLPDDSRITGLRTKNGRRHPDAPDDEYDVFEANPALTRWVRMYDRKLNDAGKQVVSGKEFAAERGLFMYLFDTEAEARANLQGVRAVFPISYREGEGLG